MGHCSKCHTKSSRIDSDVVEITSSKKVYNWDKPKEDSIDEVKYIVRAFLCEKCSGKFKIVLDNFLLRV